MASGVMGCLVLGIGGAPGAMARHGAARIAGPWLARIVLP